MVGKGFSRDLIWSFGVCTEFGWELVVFEVLLQFVHLKMIFNSSEMPLMDGLVGERDVQTDLINIHADSFGNFPK